MAVEPASKSRSPSGFISAHVASGRCNGTCIRPFWLPIFQQIIFSPRVPSMSFPGKVRKRACGPHTSECNNARKRGSPCPEALAVPELERVGLVVQVNPHKSQSCSSREAG